MADDIVTQLRLALPKDKDRIAADVNFVWLSVLIDNAAGEIERLRELLKVANSQLRAHQMLNKERSYRGRD